MVIGMKNDISEDAYFMNEALLEAKKAFALDEVPVGAIITHRGKIIARAHNQMERLQDPTAHAELLCLRAAADFFKNWRLHGVTLYSTLEPCSMCAGACFLARIEKIVWAAPDLRHGANGSFIDLFSLTHPTHNPSIVKDVLAPPASQLMRDFFRRQRTKGVQ